MSISTLGTRCSLRLTILKALLRCGVQSNLIVSYCSSLQMMTSLKHAICLQEGARSSSYSSIWLTGCWERSRAAGLRAPHPCLWLAICFLPVCCAGPAVVCGLASAEPRAGRPRCASASTLLWAICRRHASPCELPLNGSPCHLANAAVESMSSDLLASCL